MPSLFELNKQAITTLLPLKPRMICDIKKIENYETKLCEKGGNR